MANPLSVLRSEVHRNEIWFEWKVLDGTEIFDKWLKVLDEQKWKQHQKIALLIDNCLDNSHNSGEKMQHAKIFFTIQLHVKDAAHRPRSNKKSKGALQEKNS